MVPLAVLSTISVSGSSKKSNALVHWKKKRTCITQIEWEQSALVDWIEDSARHSEEVNDCEDEYQKKIGAYNDLKTFTAKQPRWKCMLWIRMI